MSGGDSIPEDNPRPMLHAEFSVSHPRPSLPARIAFAVAGLLILLLAIVILIPLLLLAAVALLAGVAVVAASRMLRSLRNPNGVLDGRRNVRVILPPDR
jgi:hypothetical protein